MRWPMSTDARKSGLLPLAIGALSGLVLASTAALARFEKVGQT